MIAIVLGTRAELIKTFPVMLELNKRNIPYVFIHTGQHSLGHLTKELGVKDPDVVLTPPPEKASTKFWVKMWRAIAWNLLLVPKIWGALRKIPNLKWVLYHGDTMSTASAAIAASRILNPAKKFRNAHLEAGLRSKSLREPFPEEMARRICDLFSDTLFAVSTGTEQNLKREHQRGKIINTGNTIVDSTELTYQLARKKGIRPPKEKQYALLTIHRDENIRYKERLEPIVEILGKIPITTYFALHDNTKKKLKEFGLWDKLNSYPHLKISPLKNYIEFIVWLKHCSLMITDGGSIQEESLVFKTPSILLRKLTERDEGLGTGLNFLTNLDVERAEKLIKKVLDPKWAVSDFKNPYGEYGVSKKVVDELVKFNS